MVAEPSNEKTLQIFVLNILVKTRFGGGFSVDSVILPKSYLWSWVTSAQAVPIMSKTI